MKLSSVILTASSAVNSAAAFLSNKVVVPSLRAAGDLKAHGLKRAYDEHDKAYWKRVDALVATRQFAKDLEAEVKEKDSQRNQVLRSLRKHEKERII